MFIHLDTCTDIEKMIDTVHVTKRRIGIVVDLDMAPEEIECYLDKVDAVLVTAVTTGSECESFRPEVIRKISVLKHMGDAHNKEIAIYVDGGINSTIIRDVVRAGADNVIVGSALFYSDNVKEALDSLIVSASEIELELKLSAARKKAY